LLDIAHRCLASLLWPRGVVPEGAAGRTVRPEPTSFNRCHRCSYNDVIVPYHIAARKRGNVRACHDGQMQIDAARGDITTLAVDAVVNAANARLVPGGGVDGAINAAAGPELAAAMRAHGGCAVGDAKPTPGFRLPARWVIHTVGPVWQGGTAGEPDLLASCYRRSLEIAAELGATSVAFPAISTGVYGYPVDDAAEIAVATVRTFDGPIDRVVLCAFDAGTYERYVRLLG
jgi:O-acetyl-ADP-ribose deacetylase (regulator of RNase III)